MEQHTRISLVYSIVCFFGHSTDNLLTVFQLKCHLKLFVVDFQLAAARPKAVDMLLTNFHLPCSTLLMLVSCFCEREMVLAAYEKAKAEKMRFYSYGDCMLLI